jgi:hypothetical protein
LLSVWQSGLLRCGRADPVRIDGSHGAGRLLLFLRQTDAARFSYRVKPLVRGAGRGERSVVLGRMIAFAV